MTSGPRPYTHQVSATAATMRAKQAIRARFDMAESTAVRRGYLAARAVKKL